MEATMRKITEDRYAQEKDVAEIVCKKHFEAIFNDHIGELLSPVCRTMTKVTATYPEDLLYDVVSMQKLMRVYDRAMIQPPSDIPLYTLGVHDCGIDANRAVEAKLSCPEAYGKKPYDAIFRLRYCDRSHCLVMTKAEC